MGAPSVLMIAWLFGTDYSKLAERHDALFVSKKFLDLGALQTDTQDTEYLIIEESKARRMADMAFEKWGEYRKDFPDCDDTALVLSAGLVKESYQSGLELRPTFFFSRIVYPDGKVHRNIVWLVLSYPDGKMGVPEYKLLFLEGQSGKWSKLGPDDKLEMVWD